MVHRRALQFFLAACLLASACLHAREAEPELPAPVRAWEHESSDLAPDPAIHFGHFPNGLRWAWARNPEPRSRSYLRLHVDVGSLAEEDSERGLAHFLEHMAFNGSEHFPAGTLVGGAVAENHDLAATLVHSARSSDVRTTIVDGRILMRDRELLTIDVPATVKAMGQRMPALLDRSHGRRIQDYDT